MDAAIWIAIITVIANALIAAGGWYAARESREKIKAEGKKLNVEYWEGQALDLRTRIEAMEKSHATQMVRMTNAFDYLCAEVRHDYPEAVRIARLISEGRLQKPKDDADLDITEKHS